MRGATQTQNDEDWLYFCSAGRQTHLRFVSTDDTDACSGLRADVQDSTGEDVVENPLMPEPGTATIADLALRDGAVYRVNISADGAHCRWLFGVGPPGATAGDTYAPDVVPCLQDSVGTAQSTRDLEPNDTIAEPIGIRKPAFDVERDAYEAKGEIANGNDEEWFAFCGAKNRRALTVQLVNLDFDEDLLSNSCTEMTVALLDSNGQGLDNADPQVTGKLQRVSWTAEPGLRYYVQIRGNGSDRCRWRLRVAPRAAIADNVPLAEWEG